MNISVLKQDAARRIRQAGTLPKKLVLLSVSAVLGADLLSALVDVLANSYQGQEGLSGMATAGVLQTVNTLATLLISLAKPFWSVGLLTAIFAIYREGTASAGTLLTGFRRFPVFLRLTLLRALVLMVICIALYMPATMLFLASPWSEEFQNMAIADSGLAAGEISDALLRTALPLVGIYMALVLLVYIPVAYRLRLPEYYVLEGCNAASLAMGLSRRNTRGNVWSLVKLDLSFWWYYLGHVLLVAVLWLDKLAPLVGLSLPVQGMDAYWLCYGLYAVGFLALETFARPWVEGANVAFFQAVNVPPSQQIQPVEE